MPHFFRPIARLTSGLLFWGLLFWTWMVAANTPTWSVRAWLSDDGLPDNDVTGIAQEARGYLWVATQGGLAQFDGVRFREAPLPPAVQRSRPLIRQMLKAGDGALWLALEGGTVVSVSKTATNIFTTVDGVPAFRPSSLAQAADGAVWVGFVDGSACRISGGKVTRFTARTGLYGTGVCVLAADVRGEIWLAKAGTLSVFRGGTIEPVVKLPDGAVRLALARSANLWVLAGMQLFKLEAETNLVRVATLKPSVAGVTPSVVYESRSGAVWVGTLAGGLWRVNGAEAVPVGTSYPDIFSLAEDRENNLWVGTGGGGLNRLRPRVLELQNVDDGLPFASVRSVCEDRLGNLWVAAQNGTLGKFSGGRWENVSLDSNWSGNRVTCVADDGRGGVWVGTSHDGLRHWREGRATVYGRGDGLGGETVRALFTDRDGDLWLATESPSTVQRLRGGEFETFSRPAGARTVRTIVQDVAGTIWFGTVDGYLLRAEKGTLVDASDPALTRRKPVRCLYAAPNGDLWVGYAGAGLGRLRGGKFATISTSAGLHDAYICGMMQDDGGGFWFSSDHGIFQVRQLELESVLGGQANSVRSVLFGREESLPSLQGNFGYSPGFTRTREGKILFPTRSGLVAINPKQTQPNHLVPPVVIERVLVDGAVVAESPRGGSLALPPRHRKIEIEFTGLSFVAPENVAFRCKLEGWDDAWTSLPRGQRSVSYTRLPAGDYTLRVIACNNAGIWNESGAALPFNVEPFLWQTWWFRLAALTVLLGGVAVAVRYHSHRKYRRRLKKLEEEAVLQKERARIAKDIHDELGANLTQISLLGKFTQHDLAAPEKARAHVEKIASLARQGVKSVDEIVWAVNPRNDTLGQLLDYAGQYAVDFLSAAGIRCRIDFPVRIPEHKLPADLRHGLFMVVKEALHNAAKHSAAHEIVLRAELAGSVLQLTIADDGQGFAAAKEDALADGLRNMKQRACELGGVCHIESVPGHGTKVRVELALP